MIEALRESVSHGTKEFPFAYYCMDNIRPGFNVSLHWHDEIEILYIESGRLSLSINETSFTGIPGDIFLVNPREIHGMTSDDRTLLYHALLFPLRFATFQSRNTGSNELYLPLSEGRLLLHNRIPESAKKETERAVRQILALQKTKSPGCQLGIQIFCAQILYVLYANGCCRKLSPAGTELDIKREILKYLQDNFAGKISLKELADTFHMSEKYFSLYFKKNFNMTLTDYLNSLRLENAAKLLSETGLSVTEAAMQSGFNNVSYFIRMFQKSYGCSPLHYRKGKF